MPEKQIIAQVPDASCGYGIVPDVLADSRVSFNDRPRGFHLMGTIVSGYKNVEGKRLTVHVSPETFDRIIKSYVQMQASADTANPAWPSNDYLTAKAGAERLRELAQELDDEAEAMPAWRKPPEVR